MLINACFQVFAFKGINFDLSVNAFRIIIRQTGLNNLKNMFSKHIILIILIKSIPLINYLFEPGTGFLTGVIPGIVQLAKTY
ncbi:MAG: hypothetical protein JWP44_3285 [Mucilaginibacter sp.]|nr:hypothetical protein [Mucilaginibacter sp.]